MGISLRGLEVHRCIYPKFLRYPLVPSWWHAKNLSLTSHFHRVVLIFEVSFYCTSYIPLCSYNSVLIRTLLNSAELFYCHGVGTNNSAFKDIARIRYMVFLSQKDNSESGNTKEKAS